ncbi:hypothetical protein MLD38_001239 [Melastoma candidum]|uniref:Uncharacterized protein n=1 Tax=Melastoma candidum TaxID=119954 RepID=A0ACB9SL79_9MYRT|nr:hypothetical protein MLD38_001239 [Melastoma candidum]
MGSSSCSILPQFRFQPRIADRFRGSGPGWVSGGRRLPPYLSFVVEGSWGGAELFGFRLPESGLNRRMNWILSREPAVVGDPRTLRSLVSRKVLRVNSSWLSSSQIASSAFTMGTVAVLPFYTLMVVAPKAKLTRKCIRSGVPFIALGVLYAYLLYLSWTPDTLRLMFASKYWLPELPGIARMFSSDMTLASAWIHLLTIDLFAARQIFHDGLENEVETRHSVSLCLLFCPVGITAHFITKALTDRARNY